MGTRAVDVEGGSCTQDLTLGGGTALSVPSGPISLFLGFRSQLRVSLDSL